MTFVLFREIEDNIRDKLMQSTSFNCQNKEEIIYQPLVMIISSFTGPYCQQIHIDDEQDSMTLLQGLIELWLTILGHSIAGQWLKIYRNKSV